MTPKELIALLDEPRNGCNEYIRHPLCRNFIYTDGVQEVASKAGAYWLLDIIGTEAVPALLAPREFRVGTGLIEVNVEMDEAIISLTTSDWEPPLWKRKIVWTDFPEGKWVFKLADQGGGVCVMCLLSED